MTLQTFFHSPETWCQNAFNTPTGACCLLGALYHCYDRPTREQVRKKIIAYLETEHLIRWNDDPTRTFEDIQTLAKTLNI